MLDQKWNILTIELFIFYRKKFWGMLWPLKDRLTGGITRGTILQSYQHR